MTSSAPDSNHLNRADDPDRSEESEGTDSADRAILVPHAEFRTGLPVGHFRLIINPQRARKFVRQRLLIFPIALAVAGGGLAIALAGHPAWGLGLVALAVLANRLISMHAAKILLHLASQDEGIYFQAMEFEILEVRRAR